MQIKSPFTSLIAILLFIILIGCGHERPHTDMEELLWAYTGKDLLVSVELEHGPANNQPDAPSHLTLEVRKNWDQSHSMPGDWYNRHVDRVATNDISVLSFAATETADGLVIEESSTKRIWRIRKVDLSIEVIK